MNWKLIFALSLFGLGMGLATVFAVPSNVEPFFWLVIFVNSVWIIAAHELFFDRYLAGHPREASMPTGGIPQRAAMVLFGLVIGVVSGLVLGLFAWIASRVVKPAATAPP